jgi:hypothetical protein
MRYLILVTGILITHLSFAQIVELQDLKQKKASVKDTAIEVFYELSHYNVERTISLNPFYTGTNLGEKINETSRGLFSHVLGIRLPLGKYLFVDAGMSWLQNGELYEYVDPNSDSSLNYSTCYRYFGMPVNLIFSVPLNPIPSETNFNFFMSAGGIPHLFQSFVQRSEWTTTFGSKESQQIKSIDNPNSFMFSWHVTTGISLSTKSTWGLRVAAHYRYSITNTFTKYGEYIHKPYGIGYSLSITKKL